MFVVRDDDSHSDLLFQTSDTTWQAYNGYGGNSLYTGGRAPIPIAPTRFPTTARSRPAARHPRTRRLTPSTRWSAGWSETATTSATSPGLDADRRGAEILEHKASSPSAMTSTGRPPSGPTSRRPAPPGSTSPSSAATRSSGRRAGSRASTARHRPPHPGLLQGDPRQRQDRSQLRLDGDLARPTIQPAFRRRTPRERPQRDDLHRQRARTTIKVPAADGKLRLWRTPRSPTSAEARSRPCRRDTLGYEWDEDLDNGSRPAGLVDLSSTTFNVPARLYRLRLTTSPGTATHASDDVPRPQRRAGVRRGHRPVVVGPRRRARRRGTRPGPAHAAGDGQHPRRHGRPAGDAAGGLVPASASTDTTAPTAAITSPGAGISCVAASP